MIVIGTIEELQRTGHLRNPQVADLVIARNDDETYSVMKDRFAIGQLVNAAPKMTAVQLGEIVAVAATLKAAHKAVYG